MSDEQSDEPPTTDTEDASAAKDEQPKNAWGDPISEERQTELKVLADKQRAWAEQPEVTRGDSHFNGKLLTGAEVFWLAAYSLAGLEGDLAKVEEQLRIGFVEQLPAMHVEQADMSWARLDNADLAGAHLEGTVLLGAYFGRATLIEAHLEGAVLRQAQLEGSILLRAHLEGADLRESYLEGADFTAAHLERAYFHLAHLERAHFHKAHLERAYLGHTQTEQADFSMAHLEQADLEAANLERANLYWARLERANLVNAHLEGADLYGAHLEGANLVEARLSGADLRSAWMDSTTVLNDAMLDNTTKLGDIQWSGVGAVNLTKLNWERVPTLGDEQRAGSRDNAYEHEAVVRAYRQLAAQLRAQGMSEVADRFALRAQIRQRGALLRRGRLLQYLGSWLLALLAGYGYRPARTIFWYLVFVLGFAVLYLHFGVIDGHPFRPLEALVFSVTSFHGRGFFPGGLQLDDPVTVLAAGEAVIGLLVEISFIATFTQRFFGTK